MCVVLQHNLGKGTRWPRPRCIPSGCWCSGGIEPTVPPVKRIAFLSLARGAFALLLHLHRPGGFRSPMEPTIKGETLALPSELPINQGLEICFSTRTEPCTNNRPFDRHVRGALPLPPTPPRPTRPSCPFEPIRRVEIPYPLFGFSSVNFIRAGHAPLLHWRVNLSMTRDNSSCQCV